HNLIRRIQHDSTIGQRVSQFANLLEQLPVVALVGTAPLSKVAEVGKDLLPYTLAEAEVAEVAGAHCLLELEQAMHQPRKRNDRGSGKPGERIPVEPADTQAAAKKQCETCEKPSPRTGHRDDLLCSPGTLLAWRSGNPRL